MADEPCVEHEEVVVNEHGAAAKGRVCQGPQLVLVRWLIDVGRTPGPDDISFRKFVYEKEMLLEESMSRYARCVRAGDPKPPANHRLCILQEEAFVKPLSYLLCCFKEQTTLNFNIGPMGWLA